MSSVSLTGRGYLACGLILLGLLAPALLLAHAEDSGDKRAGGSVAEAAPRWTGSSDELNARLSSLARGKRGHAPSSTASQLREAAWQHGDELAKRIDGVLGGELKPWQDATLGERRKLRALRPEAKRFLTSMLAYHSHAKVAPSLLAPGKNGLLQFGKLVFCASIGFPWQALEVLCAAGIRGRCVTREDSLIRRVVCGYALEILLVDRPSKMPPRGMAQGIPSVSVSHFIGGRISAVLRDVWVSARPAMFGGDPIVSDEDREPFDVLVLGAQIPRAVRFARCVRADSWVEVTSAEFREARRSRNKLWDEQVRCGLALLDLCGKSDQGALRKLAVEPPDWLSDDYRSIWAQEVACARVLELVRALLTHEWDSSAKRPDLTFHDPLAGTKKALLSEAKAGLVLPATTDSLDAMWVAWVQEHDLWSRRSNTERVLDWPPR